MIRTEVRPLHWWPMCVSTHGGAPVASSSITGHGDLVSDCTDGLRPDLWVTEVLF